MRHRAIGDLTYAKAILERRDHTAYQVELQSDSRRNLEL
jgi:hypothetical protein